MRVNLESWCSECRHQTSARDTQMSMIKTRGMRPAHQPRAPRLPGERGPDHRNTQRA